MAVNEDECLSFNSVAKRVRFPLGHYYIKSQWTKYLSANKK
jgi:hypothetical protein